MQIPHPLPEKSAAPAIDPQWTILKILQWTTSFFTTHAIDSPRLTAEILLAHVLDARRIDLYLRFDQPLNAGELADYREVIKRRVRREPVAYITGTREFWGLDFTVSPDVLIPRPETEFIVEESIKLIPAGAGSGRWRILDIGTGSGAVVVSLAKNRPEHWFAASDISRTAVSIASANAARHQVADRVHFFLGDSFLPIRPSAKKFDLIVSNPPYIATGDINGLDPEVGRYEPRQALDGGKHGLDIIKRIVGDAPAYLKKGGFLMIEIGFDQKEKVAELVETDGRYPELTFIRDYGGHDRVAKMRHH